MLLWNPVTILKGEYKLTRWKEGFCDIILFCCSLPPFWSSFFPINVSVLQVSLLRLFFCISLVLWHYCFRPFCLNNSLLSNNCSFFLFCAWIRFSNCFMHIYTWLFRFRVNSFFFPDLFPCVPDFCWCAKPTPFPIPSYLVCSQRLLVLLSWYCQSPLYSR